jgi:HEAT repeat protein
MRRLQDRDWASRKAAVESLGSLITGDARVLDGVMLHLESRSERARQTAVWTLSRIVGRGNRAAVDRLVERIAHPLLEVRMAAVKALGQVRRPTPSPAPAAPACAPCRPGRTGTGPRPISGGGV